MSLPEAAEIETLPIGDLRSLVASLLAEIVRLEMVEATMALFAFYHCNGGSFAASVSRVKPSHFYCAAGGSVSVGMPASGSAVTNGTQRATPNCLLLRTLCGNRASRSIH